MIGRCHQCVLSITTAGCTQDCSAMAVRNPDRTCSCAVFWPSRPRARAVCPPSRMVPLSSTSRDSASQVFGQDVLAPHAAAYSVPEARQRWKTRRSSANYRKVGTRDHHHHRTHLGMDVAEDVGHALAIEMDGARGARFVESEIELLAVEQREHVVEPGIEVGELTVDPLVTTSK